TEVLETETTKEMALANRVRPVSQDGTQIVEGHATLVSLAAKGYDAEGCAGHGQLGQLRGDRLVDSTGGFQCRLEGGFVDGTIHIAAGDIGRQILSRHRELTDQLGRNLAIRLSECDAGRSARHRDVEQQSF